MHTLEKSSRAPLLGLAAKKKQRTRTLLAEAAAALFYERGYDATTIDDIAAAAEISPRTFYRYFPTKEDLVVA
ncbi:MAG TPA: helix-turn-helix domain-containing protein, partial [Acidimicrobiales bacterium]|nr:helix-turn-helix domain-containing protein [Acidimicrobiales bacterium]